MLYMEGQDRAVQYMAGQDRAGQDRAVQYMGGQGRVMQCGTGRGRAGKGRVGTLPHTDPENPSSVMYPPLVQEPNVVATTTPIIHLSPVINSG